MVLRRCNWAEILFIISREYQINIKKHKNGLRKNGYIKRIDTYDLINHLKKNYPIPDDNSIAFSILKKEEKQELISFLEKMFSGKMGL